MNRKNCCFPIRDGQKRLFTRRDRARLKLILRGKRFGFSLEEIRQLLELYHVGEIANCKMPAKDSPHSFHTIMIGGLYEEEWQDYSISLFD